MTHDLINNNPKIELYCGDARKILKILPDESIDCCITSPPYWALRDYQLEPQIWDGDEKCQHEWRDKQITLKHKSGETNPGKEGWYKDKGASDDKGNNFCSLCNAWRGSLGLEPTFELYLEHLWQIFDEVKRVLKKTGTCWVNLGDSYGGFQGKYAGWPDQKLGLGEEIPRQQKPKEFSKSLLQIPSRFAIGMTDRGWILRNEIIWYKRNCMPSSANDRFTVDFEKIFFFVKEKKYFFEQQYEPYSPITLADGRIIRIQAGQKLKHTRWKQYTENKIQEPSDIRDRIMKGTDITKGRNMRTVWNIPTQPFKGAHFAVFPEALVEPMVKSGTPPKVCPKCGGIFK